MLGLLGRQFLQARVDSMEEELDEAQSIIRKCKEFVVNSIGKDDLFARLH